MTKLNKGVLKTILLEKAPFCEEVMTTLWGISTGISIYNHISNILTIYIILYSINILLISTTTIIILSVFFKNADFLLWLIFSRTEAFPVFFSNNIEKYRKMVVKKHGKLISSGIPERKPIFVLFGKVTNSHFWLRKARNLLKNRIVNKRSYCREKWEIQKNAGYESCLIRLRFILARKALALVHKSAFSPAKPKFVFA